MQKKLILRVSMVVFILFYALIVSAEVHKYTDDSGRVWYVDKKESVPAKYRDKATKRGRMEIIERGHAENAEPNTLKEAMVLEEPLGRYKSGEYRSLKIIGEEKFVETIKRSLNILRYQAPGAFTMVRQHVGKIQQGKPTRMWTSENPPTMTIDRKSAYHTDTFTAGIIVHEACHSKLYKEGGNADPEDYDAIQKEELECIEYEKNVLRQIGAPQYEIEMAESQDGTHFDIDKDGDFDLEDYKGMSQ